MELFTNLCLTITKKTASGIKWLQLSMVSNLVPERSVLTPVLLLIDIYDVAIGINSQIKFFADDTR